MGYLGLVTARHGVGAGVATVVGVTLALAIYMLASVGGLASIALEAPWLFQALRAAGIGYLLWLALDAWRGSPGLDAPTSDDPPGFGRFAVRGFVANALNPKAAVFYLTVLPSFTTAQSSRAAAAQALGLGCIHLAVSVVVHLGVVALAAGAAPRVFKGAGGDKWLRAGFSAGLVAVAVWVAWTTRAA